MQNIRFPLTLSPQIFVSCPYARDRADSPLPMLPGSDSVRRPGDERCCSSACRKIRGSRICKLSRVLRGPSIPGCFSDRAAGSTDAPQQGHQPAAPGRRRSGPIRAVRRAAPSMGSRRTTGWPLDSFQKGS